MRPILLGSALALAAGIACLDIDAQHRACIDAGRCADPVSVDEDGGADSADGGDDAGSQSTADGGETDAGDSDDAGTTPDAGSEPGDDAGMPDAGLLPNGSACEFGSECGSSHCVDNTCCDQECSGGCGTCGSGSCEPLGMGAAGSCVGYYCDGTGIECPTTCDEHQDCAPGYYCPLSSNTCEPKKLNGDPCDFGVECSSGFCADGVCCNKGCNFPCETCVGSVVGMCEPEQPGTYEAACDPYLCTGSSMCQFDCTVTQDCAPGYVCDGVSCYVPSGSDGGTGFDAGQSLDGGGIPFAWGTVTAVLAGRGHAPTATDDLTLICFEIAPYMMGPDAGTGAVTPGQIGCAYSSDGGSYGPTVTQSFGISGYSPHLSSTGSSLYFSGTDGGPSQIFVAQRFSSTTFSNPVAIGGTQGGVDPSVTADGLSLFFSGAGSLNPSQLDIFTSSPPGAQVSSVIASGADERQASIAPDHSYIVYLESGAFVAAPWNGVSFGLPVGTQVFGPGVSHPQILSGNRLLYECPSCGQTFYVAYPQ